MNLRPHRPEEVTLKQEWVRQCWALASKTEDLYSGCRKILRNRVVHLGTLDDSLTLADSGYTSSKMTMLTKNYLHEESRAMAVSLWKLRCQKRKYGSVSFTTFNHFVKGKGTLEEILAKKSKRASTFGPCIQSVCITWIDKDNVGIDVYWRTTEWFKKFPADLVFLRDVLLKPFDFHGANVTLTGHFANITMHPMYAVTVFPHTEELSSTLNALRSKDRYFFDWLIRWTSRYLIKEHSRGIQKFSQALRVQKDALARIKNLKEVRQYLEHHHPGFKKDYVAPEDEE